MPDAQMDEFIRKHMGLAKKAALDFAQRYGVDFDDAFSDAQYMLWQAAKTWNASGGASFATWYLRWAGMGLYNRRFHRKRVQTVSYDELIESTHFDVIDTQPYLDIDIDEITRGWTKSRKTVFDLIYFQGLTTKQCAEKLGMTVQGVSRHCRNIEHIIREELTKDDPYKRKRHKSR